MHRIYCCTTRRQLSKLETPDMSKLMSELLQSTWIRMPHRSHADIHIGTRLNRMLRALGVGCRGCLALKSGDANFAMSTFQRPLPRQPAQLLVEPHTIDCYILRVSKHVGCCSKLCSFVRCCSKSEISSFFVQKTSLLMSEHILRYGELNPGSHGSSLP